MMCYKCCYREEGNRRAVSALLFSTFQRMFPRGVHVNLSRGLFSANKPALLLSRNIVVDLYLPGRPETFEVGIPFC